MRARRSLPVARRRPRTRAALAVSAVGALVLAPTTGAHADDVAPPSEPPQADAPATPEIALPTAEPEDQVPPPPAAEVSADVPADAPAAAPAEVPAEAYFGTHKLQFRVSVTVDPLADNIFSAGVTDADGVPLTGQGLGPTDVLRLSIDGSKTLVLSVLDADEDYWFVGSPLIVPPCPADEPSSTTTCSTSFTAPLERKQRWLRFAVAAGSGPVAGATVELRRLDPATGATAFVAGTGTTDASGIVDFGRMPTGDYDAVVLPTPGLVQVAPGVIEVPALATRAASLDAANAMTTTLQVGPYASRLVTPTFAPAPAAPVGADLSGVVEVRRVAAGGAESTERVTIGPDGRATAPLAQSPGETLELAVVDPPAGYMADRTATVQPCATVDGAPCPPSEAAIAVPAAYRLVQVTVAAEGPPTLLDGIAAIVVDPATSALVATGSTDPTGRVLLTARIPVGTYGLLAARTSTGPGSYDLTGGRSIEVTAVDSVAEAEASPQTFDVTVGPYGQREVVPVVRSADPAAGGADLSSEVRISWTGTAGVAQQSFALPAAGRGPSVSQSSAPVTVELVTPPAGYMLPADSVVTVAPCRLDLEVACAPAEVTFDVVPSHRRVTLRALDADGRPVPGVTMELYGPTAPSPTPSPSPAGEAVLLAATPAPPGRARIGGGTTSATGAVALAAAVPPAPGYVVVVTGVPSGYTLPQAVAVDIPAVRSVTDADLALDVRLTRLPTVGPSGAPGTPPAQGAAPARPPRIGAGALPATGAEPAGTLRLALLLVVLGAAGVAARRRLGCARQGPA